MINLDQCMADHKASFADYDKDKVEEIRKRAGPLDAELFQLLGKLYNGNEHSVVSDIHEKIQKTIDRARKEHGEDVGDFYDITYGCVVDDNLNRILDQSM